MQNSASTSVPIVLPDNKNQPPVLPESTVAEILGKQKFRKVQDKQTRDLVLNILKLCKAESVKNALIIPPLAVRSRVSMYVDVTEGTVSKIKQRKVRKRKIDATTELQPLVTSKRPYFKSILDDRDIIIIKKLIHEYYIKYRKVPPLHRLHPVIADKIPTFKNGIRFLYEVVQYMGYKRKKYYSKRSVLIEDPAMTAYRHKYLKAMKTLRDNIQNLFYVYECVIDKSFTLHKSSFQKYNNNNALKDKQTFLFICAGSINGFLQNTTLLLNKASNPYIVYPSALNASSFQKWLKNNLIPNLPPNCTIVMDDSPHHCAEEDAPISYYSSKTVMCEYLKLKSVECNENMRRSELYKLVEANRPKDKNYVVDNILKKHGHGVIRLPPNMVDLNPVQHAMDVVQQKFLDDEPTCNFNITNIGFALGRMMTSLNTEDWKEFSKTVAALEDDLWMQDQEYEVALGEVILDMRDSNENGSEEESEFDSDIEDSKT